MTSLYDYMPPPEWFRYKDPIDRLPGWDELVAQLAEAIEERLSRGQRHVHAKRGGCPECAAAAADTVVRYLEANTRVLRSEALAQDVQERARGIIKKIPYLGSGAHLRLTGDLGADPAFPTVDDLLVDLEAIRDRTIAMVEERHRLEAELRQYRAWHDAVRSLAEETVEAFDLLDPSTIAEREQT